MVKIAEENNFDNTERISIEEGHSRLSRRSFIKAVALSLGATGAVAGYGPRAAHAISKSKKRQLSMAGYKLDRTEALIEGRVKIPDYNINFREAGIGDLNTNVFSGPQTLDVTEIGLHPFMLAYANDGFRDYTLLPIFPLRLFRHRSVFIRPDSSIRKPEDLRGKKVAAAGYASTSLTWIRGIFQEEYDLKPEDMQWIIAAKDSSAEDVGKTSKQERALPKNVPIHMGPKGIDESELLVSGEVDAIFHAAEPRAFKEGHGSIVRLFQDYRATEQAYYSKTGIFPIMHAVAVKKDFVRGNPHLLKAIFDAYSESKQTAYRFLANEAWFRVSLPWVGQEFVKTRALMGQNYYSYGIEPNREVLETLCRYSHQQGLCSRELTVEELFEPGSLSFREK